MKVYVIFKMFKYKLEFVIKIFIFEGGLGGKIVY